jgi:hypothetical protein
VGLRTAPGGAAPPAVQVFEHDISTVVLAANAALIPEALRFVSERRRVPANPRLFDFHARMYPDYAVALCCFDNRDAARSAPLLLWYEPLHPDRAEVPPAEVPPAQVPPAQVPPAQVPPAQVPPAQGDHPTPTLVACGFGRKGVPQAVDNRLRSSGE